jgi:hypothetical protein
MNLHSDFSENSKQIIQKIFFISAVVYNKKILEVLDATLLNI